MINSQYKRNSVKGVVILPITKIKKKGFLAKRVQKTPAFKQC